MNQGEDYAQPIASNGDFVVKRTNTVRKQDVRGGWSWAETYGELGNGLSKFEVGRSMVTPPQYLGNTS